MWTIESELIDSPLFTQNSGAAREWRRRRRRKKGMGGRLTCDCSRCCWWRWRGRTVVVCGEERWQLLRCNLAFCLCFFFFFLFFFLSWLLLCFYSFSFLCTGASLSVFLLVVLPFSIFYFCVLPLLFSVPVSLLSFLLMFIFSLYAYVFQAILPPLSHSSPVNSTLFFLFLLFFWYL